MIKSVLIYLISLVIFCISISLFVKEIKEDAIAYTKENKCIHVLVSKGIERSDIAVIDGVCVVDENIYYTSLNK